MRAMCICELRSLLFTSQSRQQLRVLDSNNDDDVERDGYTNHSTTDAVARILAEATVTVVPLNAGWSSDGISSSSAAGVSPDDSSTELPYTVGRVTALFAQQIATFLS
jgi:hypothetical protein